MEKLIFNKESIYFNENLYKRVEFKNEKLLEPMKILGKCKKAKKDKNYFLNDIYVWNSYYLQSCYFVIAWWVCIFNF